MEEQERSMKLSRYTIPEVTVTTKKGMITIMDKDILGLDIMKEFDVNFFPVMQLQVSLNHDNYYTILNNIDNAKVDFKVQMYNNDKNEELDEMVKFSETILSGSFKIVNKDIDVSLDKELYDGNNNDDEREDNTSYKTLDLILFNDSHINRYRTMINEIYSGANMNAIITRLFNLCGIDRALFQRPDNTTTFKELLIPINNFLGAIEYLYMQEGIYNNGLLLFQDFDLLYFMDCKPCKVFRPNEMKSVIIEINKKTSNDISAGTYIDPIKKEIIVTNISDFTMENMNIVNRELFGNNMMLINSKSNSIKNIKFKLKADSRTNTKVHINKYGNEFIGNCISHYMSEDDNIIQIPLSDIDYRILTPNKSYTLKYMDIDLQSRFGGKYRLTGVTYNFQKTESMDFSLKTIITLKKIG